MPGVFEQVRGASAATAWQPATVVTADRPTPDSVVLRLSVPQPVLHRAGQYAVLRLTAADGFTATRSYSIAGAPGDDLVELWVERLGDGEVSSHLADVARPGDQLELRAPIGGWFAWDGVTPALAVGSGSGLVPLVSMLRHARAVGRPDLLRLVVAGRVSRGVPYADEVLPEAALVALSREATAGRPAARLAPAELAPLVGGREVAFVCGSTAFAESASSALVEVGMPSAAVRVERFGPSG